MWGLAPGPAPLGEHAHGFNVFFKGFIYFNSRYCRYAGKDKGYRIYHQKIHINMALSYVTKILQRIADMDTPTTFRQDDYTIPKNKIIKRTST